jgi:hypothetical protein
VSAGFRTPGKYAGTVVVDRWGAMYLVSGVYLMYISEQVKGGLLDLRGEQVVLDAQRVSQPINPGDGLISDYVLLLHPPDEDTSVPVRGLRIHAHASFGSERRPVFELVIENTGSSPARFVAGELGITILTLKPDKCPFIPADGPSYALVTRQSFWGPDGLTTHGAGIECGDQYSWDLEGGVVDQSVVGIDPGTSIVWRVRFDLPPGQFEFFSGYGGGVHASLGICSNQIDFDVDARGEARVVGS